MKGVQCYELFRGIALKNHAFVVVAANNFFIIGVAFSFSWSPGCHRYIGLIRPEEL